MGPLGKVLLYLGAVTAGLAIFSKGPGDEVLVGDTALVPVRKIRPEQVPLSIQAQFVALQARPESATTSVGLRVESITGDSVAGPAAGFFRTDGTAELIDVPVFNFAVKKDQISGVLKRSKASAATGNQLEKGTFV